MNKIEKLIQELCPDGVEYKLLKESCDFKRGTSITKKDISKGDVPVIAGGKHPAYYHSKFNRNGETIAISGSGANAGFVSYWTQPVFLSDSFSISPKENVCIIKYLFYYLVNYQNQIYATKKGSGVPHVHVSDLYNFLIPIPPLEVQEEIVRCLDSFAALEAELKAELKARQQQYHHYRKELLSFDENVERMKLQCIAKISNGKDHKSLEDGNIPVYGSGGIMRYANKYIYDKKSVLIPRKGSIGNVFYVDNPFWTVDTIFYTKIKEELIIPRFLYYYLKTKDLTKLNFAGGVPSLTKTILDKIIIPVPPLAEQERIVAILDKFDTLVNDISVGLPAEIEARHKQYEYYRNKLLTFKAL